MQCNKCGYEMGPFDKECDRCKRMKPSVSSSAPVANPWPVETGTIPDEVDSGQNTSGMNGDVPPEVSIMGWCWGGFGLSAIWGIGNQVWLSLLCFIPYVNLVVPFWLGFKGHEMVWKSRRFASVSQFKDTMRIWNAWGIGALIVSIPIGIIFGITAATMSVPGIQQSSSGGISTPGSYVSGVTLDQYQQLSTGMSEQDAFNILGPGTEMSRNDMAGFVTVMYQWNGSGSLGANMNAMFQNGQLVSKAQFGLR